MFERFTEKARRTIFFARYEANALGSPNIECEHLLLGLLREDPDLARGIFESPEAPAAIRREIEAHRRGEKLTTSMDLPLSHESKRVLAYAAEEAEQANNLAISTKHLLLGLLREENSAVANLLARHGVQLNRVRQVKHADDRPAVAARRRLYSLVDQLPENAWPAAEEALRKLIRGETAG